MPTRSATLADGARPAPSVDEFVVEAARFLADHATGERRTGEAEFVPGESEFSVAVFHALSFEEEQALLAELRAWNQLKAEHGYHAITWPAEYGGLGLSREHGRAYSRLEAAYTTPPRHELFSVTTGLIAPTVRQCGTLEQRERFVASFLRTDEYCCQLFSEPGAGSDLAALACRAVRDGDEWVINGQKVWSSGAQFAQWGELIARTDPDVPKHRGLTAFLVPIDAPGVEVRPIKQMSGGSSFNEVFLTDVRVPDSLRLGEVGAGWNVALTTLGFERDHSATGGSSGTRAGGTWKHVLASAQYLERTSDPVIRQELAKAYTQMRIEGFVNRRAADLRAAGAAPGPEGSLGKLLWTEGLRRMTDVVSLVLGPSLVADTGQWGTYAWGEHVLGAPGYRIAGGSDEVQRNIIGERVLGLPGEPRVDKDVPWRDIPR
jgi:alkylation response protein AidB-like acyl-CoA dehydrogenase